MSSDTSSAYEQAQLQVIGSVVLRPFEYHSLTLQIDDFTLSVCRRVYTAVGELWAEGTTPGPLEIADWSEANKGQSLKAEDVANLGKHSILSYELGTAVAIVRNLALDWKVRRVANKLSTSKKRGEQLLAEAMCAFNELGPRNQGDCVRLTTAVSELMDQAEYRQRGDATLQVLTGVADVDKMHLLDRGGVMTIAGRPSMGKSTLVQYLARRWGERGERVLLFSTESPRLKVARRFLSEATGLNSQAFGYGEDSMETWDTLGDGASRLHKLPIWVNDKADRAAEIAQTIRMMRQREGITVAVVDHIQECTTEEDPRIEINQLIAALKSACRETPKIALVLVSQLSRRVEARASRMPQLADLKESGKIEEASDSVLLLMRPHYYCVHKVEGFDDADPSLLHVFAAKNRDGKAGSMDMVWDDKNGHVLGVRDQTPSRGEK